jgi:uncharacterized protein YdhG (YjbR/CyaY superfamily)
MGVVLPITGFESNEQMSMRHESHESYFASLSPEVQELLTAIQNQVESLIPSATRCIGYNMPAYRDQRIFFYFAAFKKHIGIYPPIKHDAQLIAELAPYRGEKGNLSFPLHQALPLELIGRVALALHKEYQHKR